MLELVINVHVIMIHLFKVTDLLELVIIVEF